MTDSPYVEASVSAGGILARTGGLLRRSAARATMALALLAAPGIAIDSGLTDRDGEYALTFLNSALSITMQFWLTKALLDELGAEGSSRTRFPGFFGLILLSNLAILVGVVFLVVPGIILFVRWSISAPILLGSDDGVIESMARSWRETAGHFWPILGAFVAIYAPAVIVALAAFGVQDAMGPLLPGAIAFNLALQAAIIAGWYAAVAICTLLAEPGTLSKVFE